MDNSTYFKYRIKFFTARFKRFLFYIRKFIGKKNVRNTRKIMYQRLKFAILNKQSHILPIQDYKGYRGVGKSKILYSLAFKYKLPILVDVKSSIEIHKLNADKLGFYGIEFILLPKNINIARNYIRGMKFKDNIILIDLKFSPSEESVQLLLREFKLHLIGFAKSYQGKSNQDIITQYKRANKKINRWK